MPVSAAITFRMTMGSGYVAVIRGMPVTPSSHCESLPAPLGLRGMRGAQTERGTPQSLLSMRAQVKRRDTQP